MKIRNLLFLLLVFNCSLEGQQLINNQHFDGSGEIKAIRSEIDPDGNIYTLGNFTGDVIIGDSSFSSFLGTRDMYLLKTNIDGEFIWAHHFGGTTNNDFPKGLSVCSTADNIVVIGYYVGTLTFVDRQLSVSAPISDGFMACFSSDGSINFAINIVKGSGIVKVNDVAIDYEDSIIISGKFKDSVTVGNKKIYSGVYQQGAFIAKVDFNGNCSWAKVSNGEFFSPTFNSIGVSDEMYYFGGFYQSNVNIDTFSLTGINNDMFLLAFDYAGNSKWLRKISGSSDDFGYSVAVDEYENVYFNGYYSSGGLYVDSTAADTANTMYGNNGGTDLILTKYDNTGNLLWSEAVGSDADDELYDSYHRKGNFIVTGKYSGQMNFMGDELTPVGSSDVFGLVFDSNDDLVYIFNPGGNKSDVGKSCTIDSTGNFYLIGDFDSDLIYFDKYDTLYVDGGTDMFIAKYNKMSVDLFVTDVLCNGASNGSILATPKGIGESPFTYAWSSGGSSSIETDLGVGWHTVTVIDKTGYTVVDSAYVGQPSALSASVANTEDASCSGSGDGVIELDVSGGVSPYDFQWSSVGGSGFIQDQEDQTTVNSGTYTVTVSDDNNCTQVLTGIVVGEGASLMLSADIDTSTTGDDGAIDLSVSNGTMPYTYQWANDDDPGFDSTTQDISGLAGGEYLVTVTDAKGCNKDSSFIVFEENLWFLTALKFQPLCVGSENGSIFLKFAGDTTGEGPFNLEWSKEGDPGFSSSEYLVLDLSAGTYSATVTSASMDKDSVKVTLSDPTAINITPNVTSIVCDGENTGKIDIDVSGGSSPYTFEWSRAGDGGFSRTTEDIFNLDTGTYTVTVTDKKGCTATSQSAVNSPNDPISVEATIVDVNCPNGQNNGSISINISGGTAPYTKLWSTSATGTSISNLAPNIYFCEITDVNDCGYYFQDTVKEPDPIAIDFDVVDISCYGLTDGSLTANPTGGNGMFDYKWDDPGASETQQISGLSDGSYSVTVTDQKNCTKSASSSISEPDTLYIIGAVTSDLACYGDTTGAIALTVSGGTLPLSFTWSNGDTTQNLTSSIAGNYTVTVSDAMSCFDTKDYTVNEPNAIEVTDTVIQNVFCAGDTDGSITITVTGGSGTLVYDWSNDETSKDISGLIAGVYSVTITDDSSCVEMFDFEIQSTAGLLIDTVIAVDPSNAAASDGAITVNVTGGTSPYNYSLNGGASQSSNMFSSLDTGEYVVEVTDDMSCTISTNAITLSGDAVSVNDNLAEKVKIFPNPTTGKITLSLSSNALINYKAIVYDDKGRLLMKSNLLEKENTIDLSGFAKGIYMIRIEGTSFIERLIIE